MSSQLERNGFKPYAQFTDYTWMLRNTDKTTRDNAISNVGTSQGVEREWLVRKHILSERARLAKFQKKGPKIKKTKLTHQPGQVLGESTQANALSKGAFTATGDRGKAHLKAARGHQKAGDMAHLMSEEHPSDEMSTYYRDLSRHHGFKEELHRQLAEQHKKFPAEKKYITAESEHNEKHNIPAGVEHEIPPSEADVVVKGHPWTEHESARVHGSYRTQYHKGESVEYRKEKGKVTHLFGEHPYQRVGIKLEGGKSVTVHSEHHSLKKVQDIPVAQEIHAKPTIKTAAKKKGKSKPVSWVAHVKKLSNKAKDDEIPHGTSLDCCEGVRLHRTSKGSYLLAEPSRIPGRTHHQIISLEHAKRIIKKAKAKGKAHEKMKNSHPEQGDYNYGVSSEQNQNYNYLQTGDPDNPIKNCHSHKFHAMLASMQKEYGAERGERVAYATWEKMHNSDPHSCVSCGGTGGKDRSKCDACGGTGDQNTTGIEEELPKQSPETLTYLRERPVNNRT